MTKTPEISPELRRRLAGIRHVALDMDGTIYLGDTVFPFTAAFLGQLDRLGIGYSFLTNNPTRSRGDYLAKLLRMGIPAREEQIYTSVAVTIDYLRTHYPTARRLYMLGTPSMAGQFAESGFISISENDQEAPDAVVISFDTTLTYPRLCRAAWWLSQGLPYVATNPDRVCPTEFQTVLVDCGSLCACLETATGRRPEAVCGKPAPMMLAPLLRDHSMRPDELAMVGDRLYTDVAMAAGIGALGVLTLTGETTPEMLEGATLQPDLTVESISRFGDILQDIRR